MHSENKAHVQFKACGGYGNPQVFRSAASDGMIFQDEPMLDTIRRSKMVPPTYLGTAGEFLAKRFQVKIDVQTRARMHWSEHCVIYGYTELTDEVTDDTVIYFSRVVGLSKAEYKAPPGTGGDGTTVHVNYDNLIYLCPPGVRDEYRLSLHHVVNHATANRVFSHLAGFDSELTNLCGVIRNTSSVIPLREIDSEKYCDLLTKAIKSAVKDLNSDPLMGDPTEEVLALVGGMLQEARLEDLSLFQDFHNLTNWYHDGGVTLGELKSILAPESTFEVKDADVDVVSTNNPTEIAARIFHDHMKEAVVMASERCLESISITTWGSLFERKAAVTAFNRLYPASKLGVEDLIFNECPEPKRQMVNPPKEPAVFYGVDRYKVQVNVDFFGDITGAVVVDGGVEETFRIPAFLLGEITGLIGDEADIRKLGGLIKHHVEKATQM